MDSHTQQLLANALVGVALIYLSYRAYLRNKNKDHAGCGGCGKCAASQNVPNKNTPRPAPQAVPLITLERPKKRN
jgi:hypothetical protein